MIQGTAGRNDGNEVEVQQKARQKYFAPGFFIYV